MFGHTPKKLLIPFALLTGLTLAAAGLAWAEEVMVGSLRNVSGSAQIIRGGQTMPARNNQQLMLSDVLRTGPDGSLGIILRDDSVVSLGPDSELALEEFEFSPVENKLGMVTRMTRGTASFLTGQIGQMRPAAVRVETPNATIATRGTHFLVQVAGQ
ncbi:MAG: FecR family protein [Deltaproteobacteria bacterium]|nr:FecR family protein [Deltaproteobacteria bacterium]